MVGLLGERDEYLKVIESGFDAEINVRGNEILAQAIAEVLKEEGLVPP